uniref:Uncharacterized protein n=1 Tax=Nothobranchius furzeri TaxID=105023 RepID=A0A8C6NJW9_NOTFU
MSSIPSPLSRRFSISTSEKPRRSALEMSKTPPTAAVSTPPEKRTGSDATCS